MRPPRPALKKVGGRAGLPGDSPSLVKPVTRSPSPFLKTTQIKAGFTAGWRSPTVNPKYLLGSQAAVLVLRPAPSSPWCPVCRCSGHSRALQDTRCCSGPRGQRSQGCGEPHLHLLSALPVSCLGVPSAEGPRGCTWGGVCSSPLVFRGSSTTTDGGFPWCCLQPAHARQGRSKTQQDTELSKPA